MGGIADGFWKVVKGLFRLLIKIIVAFGVWIPALYVLLGVILHYGCGFDPFDFTVYSVVYLSGGVAAVVCCLILAVRNIIVMPFRSALNKKNVENDELWKDEEAEVTKRTERRDEEELEETLAPPLESVKKKKEQTPPYLADLDEDEDETTREDEEREAAKAELFDWLPKKAGGKTKTASVPKKEIPDIYFSALQKNILIHEYSDRFEIYKVVGDKTVHVGVEYK